MSAKSSDQPSEWSIIGWRFVFYAVLCLVVYSPALRGSFLWDDDVLLTQNSLVREAGGLQKIWFSTEPTDYFPLTYTLLWIEWRLWETDTFGYHVVGVLLHALGATLLWRVLRQLKLPGAFLAATIFAVHPVCVASVAWIAELKNTLSLVFYLLTVLLYLRFEEAGQRRLYIFSLATFLLALLSKTSVVMLPLILLGCAVWQRGNITRNDIRQVAPFFLLSLALGLVTIWFQTHRAIGERVDVPLIRMAGGGWAIWHYLFKTVLPINLNMIYPRWAIQPQSAMAWLPWLLWLGLLATLWKFRASWGKDPLFALLYFFLTLLPVLGFFDMSFFTYSRAADHLQYLSLIGIIVLVAGAVVKFLEKKKRIGKTSAVDSRVATFGTFLIIALSVLSWKRAQVFASSENLWTDTLKKNRMAWVAHNNLGDALTEQDKVPEAIEYFQTAVQLNPKYSEAYNNLGAALGYLGRLDEAAAAYKKAIEIRPNFEAAINNLGLLHARQGQLEEAEKYFRQALKVAPDYNPAHFNLGGALAQKGKFAEAAEHYRAVLRIRPDYAEAHLNLARLLTELNEFDEAAKHCQEALRWRTEYREAEAMLEKIVMKKKEWERFGRPRVESKQ